MVTAGAWVIPLIYPFPPRHCIASSANSTALSDEYRMAPAQSYQMSRFELFAKIRGTKNRNLTLRLTFPRSQALASAYTYERLAFNFVYMSAILAIQPEP